MNLKQAQGCNFIKKETLAQVSLVKAEERLKNILGLVAKG